MPETCWADYNCNKAFSNIQLVFFSKPKFLPARYTCYDIRAVRMFRVQFGECPAIQPAGTAAAVVQVADIKKKVTFTHILSVSNVQMSIFVHFEQPIH